MTQSRPSRRTFRLAVAGALALSGAGAAVVLGVVSSRAAAQKEAPVGPMSRDAAVKMIKGFLAAYKVQSTGLNEKNLGGADIEGRRVFFEYQPEKNTLRSLATVYCFRKPPKPGVIEGFKKEAEGGTDTGGGTVEYVSDSRCLFLGRSYTQAVSDAQFTKDNQRLLLAAKIWSEQVVERVATKVFHPEDAK
jgi:hypothetical protein